MTDGNYLAGDIRKTSEIRQKSGLGKDIQPMADISDNNNARNRVCQFTLGDKLYKRNKRNKIKKKKEKEVFRNREIFLAS